MDIVQFQLFNASAYYDDVSLYWLFYYVQKKSKDQANFKILMTFGSIRMVLVLKAKYWIQLKAE